MAKEKKTVGALVLAYVAKHPDKAFTSDTLAKRIGHTAATVSCACSRLARAGKLRRADDGKGRGTEALWAAR